MSEPIRKIIESFGEGSFLELTFDAAYVFVPAPAGMRSRIPRDADNTSTAMTMMLHAKLIDSESAGRIGRGWGVNHFAALSRAWRLSHDIVSRTASEHTTGSVGPSPRSLGEKGGWAKREKKTGCRCVLRFRQRRQRNDKRFAPCLTTFRFSFHGLYTSGALVKPSWSCRLSRAIVFISLYLLSRPVVHGGIRATLFSQLAALSLSLSFGVETPVKNLPSPPLSPRRSHSFFLSWSWLREIRGGVRVELWPPRPRSSKK